MNYYPMISSNDVELLRNVHVALENIQQNPLYLQDLACPYPPDVVMLLTTLHQSSVSNAEFAHSERMSQMDDKAEVNVVAECETLLTDLRRLQTESKNLTTSEKISIYKMVIGQIDKVREIKEQASQIQDYEMFKTTLFNILERYLTPAQISEFIEEFNDNAVERK